VGVSNAVRADFQPRLPSNDWRTVYNGIDTELFRNSVESADEQELRHSIKISENKYIILSVGRYVEQKSHETLIRALPQILSSVPDTHLVLVGWGEREQRLRRLAGRLDVRESVTVTGRVPEVYGYYSMADVFSLASSFEGFGIAAVEAMAAAVPVVASRVPGLDEVVVDGETGLLVSPGNPQSFAEAITVMLRENSNDFAEQGRERAERLFDISRTVAEYDEIYRELSA
jgi:glycosyltransferase involved in cell wall biosynthesis